MCGCGLGLNLLSSSLSSWIINWLMLFTWKLFCLRSEGDCTQDCVALFATVGSVCDMCKK